MNEVHQEPEYDQGATDQKLFASVGLSSDGAVKPVAHDFSNPVVIVLDGRRHATDRDIDGVPADIARPCGRRWDNFPDRQNRERDPC